MKKLSKTTLIVIIIGVIIVGGFLWGINVRNAFVRQDEAVSTAWSNVQTQYQRRADLIPNLVNTIKGYAKHEKGTLEGVIQARAKATQITIDANGLTPEKLESYQQAQGELSTALGKLLAVSERYPDLKANESFLELQAQLEGTENRINESRRIYNQEVQSYNISVRTFPANIIAGMFNFTPKVKFEASESAQKSPTVVFD